MATIFEKVELFISSSISRKLQQCFTSTKTSSFGKKQSLHQRPKYRSYSPDTLQRAYASVVEAGVPVKRAAKQFGVPQQTLRDRVKGKIDPECVTTGRAPTLSQHDEAQLVKHIETMAQYGYGYTMQEVADTATDYAVRLGVRTPDNPLTLRWIEGFRKRWPQIRVTKPRSLDFARAKVTSETTVDQYFTNLHETLVKYDLLDKPHRIFNCDEKGISLDHKPPYVVSCSGAPPSVVSGKSKTTTILGCGSAGGVAIPPYFVFHGKRMKPELLHGATPGADGTVSDSGWSNRAIFRHYIEHHFLKYVPGGNNEPLLLLLDGHKSHVSVELTEWALSKNIVIFILPAHTSHILQPMDVSVYGPFQKIYNMQCHKFLRQTSATITRYNVCELACRVYSKALSADNLQSAFRKTGICPFDKSAIDHDKLIPAEVFQEDESQATVEGGIDVEVDHAYVLFEEKEKELKKTKQKDSKKPTRNTLCKIVSGKDLTNTSVLQSMKTHEENSKGQTKSNKKRKLSDVNEVCDNKEPGPSKTRENENLPPVMSDDDDDDAVCCVCNKRTPAQLLRKRHIEFVSWAQCDRVVRGKPCLHWTHLKYCSSTRSVGTDQIFYCPHCAYNEE